MAALAGLAQYGDSDSDNDSPPVPAPKFSMQVMSIAPAVTPRGDPNAGLRLVARTAKSVDYNPTYQELCAPQAGPAKPNGEKEKVHRNAWNGYVEAGDVSDFHFEDQRQTFNYTGYALDPSVNGARGVSISDVIGDKKVAKSNGFETLATKRGGAKRKRKEVAALMRNRITVATPSEEQIEEMGTWAQNNGDAPVLSKPKKDKGEEHSVLHIKDEFDYQGRSYMHASAELGKLGVTPAKCFLPKVELHTWTGHSKGVSAVRFLPKTAHLLLSCSMDHKIKLWEFYGGRRMLRTFHGHTQAVRDVQFDNSGSRFLSCGYDRMVRLWDTETGQCIRKFSEKRVPYCVKFHPDEDKQNLFVCGTSDKHIHCYDINSGEIVQDYDRHLGAVNSITFVEEGRRMVTTSDDKSIRVWEWDIPVDMKYIADPSMHSMPAVGLHPNKKWMILQSMDNKICTFGASDRFRQNQKKTFKGHTNSGYACELGFSPDGAYVISGDGEGFLTIWDWKTSKRYAKIRAHDQVTMGAVWHPYETSKVVTCSWDGTIKLWD